ncbi:uncharacterized protein A4U43_C07F25480 [Asparagus officinalis]|uniref:DUF1279 domain-containing protein n=1 Tax=Asparagus officinalis TaxID=4686 RepID=A0A5P1EEX2_ASPOF|nr:uncharacterized protein LOC109849022 [Asparagus officinalis]ONK64402.1 uncharacterized protein A4U43_C07F25480 [Asparagus officinalis]
MAFSARMKDLMKKYGKVALGVHLSGSPSPSIGGLYVAINNKRRCRVPLPQDRPLSPASMTLALSPSSATRHGSSSTPASPLPAAAEAALLRGTGRTELAASSGGALALALLCNKALFPVRVPITIALTPPIARFLRRRNLIKGF